MEQKTTKLYSSAPLMSSDQDLEQRMEIKLKNVNTFINSVNNIKEVIAYFKHKNHKSKKTY